MAYAQQFKDLKVFALNKQRPYKELLSSDV